MPINKFNHCISKKQFKSAKVAQNFLNKARKGGDNNFGHHDNILV